MSRVEFYLNHTNEPRATEEQIREAARIAREAIKVASGKPFSAFLERRRTIKSPSEKLHNTKILQPV